MIDRRLGLALVSAMALHIAVLAGVMFRQDATTGLPGSVARGAVDVRLVALASSVHEAPVSAATDTRPKDGVDSAPTPHPKPMASLARAETAQPGSRDDGDEARLNGYVPRRWLTVAPEPVTPIVLPFPAEFQDRARYKVILDLYIEADGRVSRVEFEGVPLPAVLQRAARSTFEHAMFTPGQVKGRIVKSLIQIEVDFDALSAS